MKVKKLLLAASMAIATLATTLSAQASYIVPFTQLDGCSTPSISGITQWKGWGKACNTHDWHYSRWGMDKKEADIYLRNSQKAICSDNYKWYDARRALCRETADLWYEALSRGTTAHQSYADYQENTRQSVVNWVNANRGNPGVFPEIRTTYPIADLYNADQQTYIHHVDYKYVRELVKVKSGTELNMTTADQWYALADLLNGGVGSFDSWRSNLMSQWNVRECPMGNYETTCPVCTVVDYSPLGKPIVECK